MAFQRLAKVFDALGRSEDAAQYRARGILVSDTEFAAEEIYKSQSDLAMVKRMARYMIWASIRNFAVDNDAVARQRISAAGSDCPPKTGIS